jgi:hypothetical protein
MHMIAHEDPCVNGTFGFGYVLPQALQELAPILIIDEDIRFVVSPDHDVV